MKSDEDIKLVGSPRCLGCLQHCQFNGPVISEYKAGEQKGGALNKCNTSIRKRLKVHEVDTLALLHEMGGLADEVEKYQAEMAI